METAATQKDNFTLLLEAYRLELSNSKSLRESLDRETAANEELRARLRQAEEEKDLLNGAVSWFRGIVASAANGELDLDDIKTLWEDLTAKVQKEAEEELIQEARDILRGKI